VAAGVPTVIVVQTDFTSEDLPAWDVTITVVLGNLAVVVTGFAGTVTWTASTDIVETF
jgi:hypothetical protein